MNREGAECEACHGVPSAWLCSKCWRSAKRDGICPFCFEHMPVVMQGRRKLRLHSKSLCRLADPGWRDRIGPGETDPRPRIITAVP